MDKGNLENKSLADLRYIAKMMNIQSPTKYKKDELIALIVNSSAVENKVSAGEKNVVTESAEPTKKNGKKTTSAKKNAVSKDSSVAKKTAVAKKSEIADNVVEENIAVDDKKEVADDSVKVIEQEPAADTKKQKEKTVKAVKEKKDTAKSDKKPSRRTSAKSSEAKVEIAVATEVKSEEVVAVSESEKVSISETLNTEKNTAESAEIKAPRKRGCKKIAEGNKVSERTEDITVSEIPVAEVTETVDEVVEQAEENTEETQTSEKITDADESVVSDEVSDGENPEVSVSAENANIPVKEQRSQSDNGKDVEGILELMQEGYGFLRVENFVSSSKDIYVPPTLIRKYGLKTGDLVCGKCRFQKDSDRSQALMWISTVNGYSLSEHPRRRPFETLIPIYPEEKFVLEVDKKELSTRLIDLIAPIGKGQRGMIVSPPKAGKTVLLKKIANSITANYPDAELFVLLIDERPEEVTDMKESVNGTVVSSTFDELPERHIKVSELVLERAQRLVEYGKDVVILMDSITRLARAYNLTIPPTGRSLSGGLDPGALHKPKKFFGAARNIRGGGSLTIVATALVDTGSKLDDVIFEEFKGTGNMELHLDRKLSEKRIFPAIDINKSGTRREDLLLTEKELNTIFNIRRAMSNLGTADVTEILVNQLTKTENNEEFIASVKFSEKDGK